MPTTRTPEGQHADGARKASREAVDGLLLLNKPAGLSSNAALQRARRLLNAVKAGHTGTLDPFAEGLLPLCFGDATKFSRFLLEADKHYHAVMRLGITTTTGDPEGDVLERRAVRVTRAQVEAAMAPLRGEIEQTPPMYSALKVAGKPLYEYARAGIVLPRAARQVRIAQLEVLALEGDLLSFEVRCSSGTYVRTLAEDLGGALGCGGHLVRLVRTATGGFHIDRAVTLDALETLPPTQRSALLQPVDALVAHLPALILTEPDARALAQGRTAPCAADGALLRLYGPLGRFLGLGQCAGAGLLRAKRLVAQKTACQKQAKTSHY